MSKDRQILEQAEKIMDLQKELNYKEKEHVVDVERVRIEEEEKRLEQANELRGFKVKCEQLQARIDESPYKQLENLLKVLAVKLPTVDIKSLSVATKGK